MAGFDQGGILGFDLHGGVADAEVAANMGAGELQHGLAVGPLVDQQMTAEGMDAYLSAFKAGMPPHGGLGIGLERLTMKLCNEDNVRETTLFPRDMSRLEP